MSSGGVNNDIAADILSLYRILFSTFTEREILDELIIYPILAIRAELQRGRISASELIDFSGLPNIFQLIPSLELFEEIILLTPNDASGTDMQRFANDDNNEIDLSRVLKLITEREGSGRSSEKTTGGPLIQNVKCDFNQENPTYPVVLKKSDYLLSSFILNFICTDLDSYRMCLKKMYDMLKEKGTLILIGLFDAKFFIVGNKKFPLLTFNESFLKQALMDTRFKIEYFDSIPSKAPHDLVSYGNVWCVRATKTTE